MDALPGGARWPILMASRAIRQLQKLQQDQKVLDIVQKKIKELSNGKFTFENHCMVIDTAEHIPIYRARVANDLRILYQIDIESETSNPYDRQVIRIFVIQPRAQVDYSFWPKVSRHLAGKGSEYRHKCIFRLSKEAYPDVEYSPAMFPHQDYRLVAAPKVEGNQGDHEEHNNVQAEVPV
ncbi:hypothetical protein FRC08_015212 [Ceratobasidium sp. 394]|nr:hypothetical protein FRC08_015212 [Ceratobasidium sp. 394]